MAVLEITDDCLFPERFIYLVYTGPDPWDVVEKVSDSIKGFFHVSTSGTNNDRLNWDISGNNTTFYSSWWVKKNMSGIAYLHVVIKVQGEKSKTDKSGQFRVELSADLVTKFEGPRILLKPVWLTYSYLFYNKVRQRQLERCRDLLYNFRNLIKEHYNLRITSVGEAHTVFGGQ